MSNREFVKELLQVMNDNPTLEVLCKVDSEIVGVEGYAWWLGKLNTYSGVDIDEYSDCIGETIKFRSDDEYEEWIEDVICYDDEQYKELSDKEWNDFCRKKVDEVANWKKAIFVSVTTI